MNKRIVTVIIIMTMLTTSACKDTANKVQDDGPKNVTVVPDSYEDAFSEVLDRSFYALKNPYIYNDFNSSSYNNCWMAVYVKEQDATGSPLDFAGYGFIDLNSDGIKELIVGSLVDDTKLDKMIYSVYSLQHNIPKNILHSYDYGTPATTNYKYVYLCADNKFLTEYSDHSYGSNIDRVSEVNLSGNGLTIETKESNKSLSEYESQKIQPDLIPFSQYTPKNPEENYPDEDDNIFEEQWIFGTGFSSWKEGYLACINDNFYSPDSFALINIDNDDVPELVVEGTVIIYSYHDGTVTALSIDNTSSFTYIEKQGLAEVTGGRMGVYYDRVYSLSEGQWKCIFLGNEYAEDYCDYDEETGAYMSYKIDGTEVDKQTYDETLNNIYDKNSSRHVNNDDFREKEELISAFSIE